MKTEITYEELISAWAPLADAQLNVENSGNKFLIEKLNSAEAPLRKLIEKIEKENPERFG